jgi:hypothetical protein
MLDILEAALQAGCVYREQASDCSDEHTALRVVTAVQCCHLTRKCKTCKLLGAWNRVMWFPVCWISWRYTHAQNCTDNTRNAVTQKHRKASQLTCLKHRGHHMHLHLTHCKTLRCTHTALSRYWVWLVEGVRIGNWIYWTHTERNYK